MKFIEIAVPDSFDDSQKTTFEALDENLCISPASSVGRDEMLDALMKIEAHLCIYQGPDPDVQASALNHVRSIIAKAKTSQVPV